MSENEANIDNAVMCPRCRTVVTWPSSLSDGDKSSIAQTARFNALEGTKRLHDQFGLDLRQAKGAALHITRIPGQCHRCKAPVSGAISVCPNCRSANLDW
ncbi:hypothetical protein [Inquilinus sp. CA228]|uniref:hypothetical protein n=1 Tax=Inquilinus sp. CA228 TaxID=3455609 RepID=UPI003F8D0675